MTIYQNNTARQNTLIPRTPDGAKIVWSNSTFQMQLFDVDDVGSYFCGLKEVLPVADFVLSGWYENKELKYLFSYEPLSIEGGRAVFKEEVEADVEVLKEPWAAKQPVNSACCNSSQHTDKVFVLLGTNKPIGDGWVKISATKDLHKDNSVIIDQSENINLLCYSTYRPSLPSFTWTRTGMAGRKVKVGSSTQAWSRWVIQSVLEIRNASKRDEGTYTCSLDVGGKQLTAKAKITVKGNGSLNCEVCLG